MPYEALTGLNVSSQYGARNTGGVVGVETDKDNIHQLEWQFTGRSLNEGFLPPVVVKRGTHMYRYILRIDEAFDLTGTTPGIAFGAFGGPGANGVALTEAELESVGTKTPASTGAGTWAVSSATGVTTDAKCAFVLTGTTPAVNPNVGKGTLIIEYVFATKV